jgi:hypothetical protein
MLAVVVAEGVAIALLAVLVLGLLRSHALILRALHELGAGLELEEAAVPDTPPGPVPVRLEPGVVPASRAATNRSTDVVGTTLDGTPARVEVTGEGRRTLLAFLSSGCSVCRDFWAQLSSGEVDVPGQARLAVVTQGPQEESVTRLRQLAGPRLEVVRSSEAWNDYGVPGSPYFVYVEDGVVTGEGSSTTWAQVRDLMGQAVDDAAAGRRARAGDDGTATGRAAGRDSDDRDDPASIDRELLGAGLHPGHPSLYQPPEAADADREAADADREAVEAAGAAAVDAERARR